MSSIEDTSFLSIYINKNCITKAILKLVAGRESAVYFGVNEDFEAKPDAKRALLDNFIPALCSAMVKYQYAA